MPHRPIALGLLLALGLAAGVGRAHAEPVPPPRFDRADHAQPASHLGISPKVGTEAKLRALATQLRGADAAATLAALAQWLNRNLHHDASSGAAWRSFDQMLQDRTVGGNADLAVLLGTMARAAGIPAIWVKTVDVGWIRDFQAGRPEGREIRAHVFLEVHVDGAWRLLDPQTMHLWDAYDPTNRVLPGDRFAYDKGDDPYELVLPNRADLFASQARSYFAALDPAALPWGRFRDLLRPWRVYVAGQGSVARYAEEASRRLGFRVEGTFHTDWEHQLARARGKTLIVTCDGRRPSLPESLWAAWLPSGTPALAAGGPLPAEGFLEQRLADGTRVILVPGQDLTSVQVGVAKALR